MARMRNFSQSPGLITSFSQSVVSGEFFLGYHGWETLNRNASIYTTHHGSKLKVQCHKNLVPYESSVSMTITKA
jgi:hypothetical protein